jgi:hypothetical protein
VVFYGRVDFLICIRKKHNYKVPIIPQNTSERVIRAKEAKVWYILTIAYVHKLYNFLQTHPLWLVLRLNEYNYSLNNKPKSLFGAQYLVAFF